ncbi:MAG TPA: rRNA maturation RNase YbeY [Mycobacteriales bacterium]|jgi:probable rRNA maturation factor|nr:rRNA maturation RNase YbeY [Mycobacteriales bacterium]
MSVFVANESGVALDEQDLVGILRFAFEQWGINPQADVSLLAVDVQAMTDLHVQWMGEPGPTDVLAFPMDELTEHGSWEANPKAPGPALLGDVVVCPAVAVSQAAERGHTFAHELRVLAIHGLLHLLGYDHAEPDAEQEMFRRQDTLVAAWETDLAGRRP